MLRSGPSKFAIEIKAGSNTEGVISTVRTGAAEVSPEPRIGLFWGLPGAGSWPRLIGLSRRVSKVSEIGGFRTLEEGHVDVWPQITRRWANLRGVP